MTQPISPVRIGQVLKGTYEIVAFVSEGGCGLVYKGRHTRLTHRHVIIKVLQRAFQSEARERFIREATAAAALDHPNAVTVFDYDVLDSGEPFIVMEYLPGHDLEAELEWAGPLTQARVVDLFPGCLEALAQAHEQGIVHKDLKPSNLFIKHAGTLQESLIILDFGIARIDNDQLLDSGPPSHTSGSTRRRLTLSRQATGTPQYMAPEYIKDPRHAPPSIDVYQMGLILVEALTGELVVNEETSFACCSMHVRGELNIPEALLSDPQLGPLIRGATALDPADRYPNAGAFLAAFTQTFDLARTSGKYLPLQPSQDHTTRPKLPAFGSGDFSSISADRLPILEAHPLGARPLDVFAASSAGMIDAFTEADPLSPSAPPPPPGAPASSKRPNTDVLSGEFLALLRTDNPPDPSAFLTPAATPAPITPSSPAPPVSASAPTSRHATPAPIELGDDDIAHDAPTEAPPAPTAPSAPLTALPAALDNSPAASAPIPPPPPDTAPPPSKRGLWVIAMGLVAGLVVSGATLMFYAQEPASQPTAQAEPASLASPDPAAALADPAEPPTAQAPEAQPDAAASAPKAAPPAELAPTARANLWVTVQPAPRPVLLGIRSPNLKLRGFRPRRMRMAPTEPYALQQHEVTWSELEPWLAQSPKHRFNPPNHAPKTPQERAELPATGVPWATARAYCVALGGDLPTEAQWEFAARSARRHAFAWGNAPLQTAKTRTQAPPVAVMTSPQDRTPADDAAQALYDLTGNAIEWTRDLAWADVPQHDESEAALQAAARYSVRGYPIDHTGPNPPPYAGLAHRDAGCGGDACADDAALQARLAVTGFRCAKPAAP